MSIELSAGSIHPADGPDFVSPVLSLDEVRALLRGALPDAVTATSKVLTIGDVLWLWRAAERLLQAIDAGSPECEATVADISDLRAQYQRLFEARQRDE